MDQSHLLPKIADLNCRIDSAFGEQVKKLKVRRDILLKSAFPLIKTDLERDIFHLLGPGVYTEFEFGEPRYIFTVIDPNLKKIVYEKNFSKDDDIIGIIQKEEENGYEWRLWNPSGQADKPIYIENEWYSVTDLLETLAHEVLHIYGDDRSLPLFLHGSTIIEETLCELFGNLRLNTYFRLTNGELKKRLIKNYQLTQETSQVRLKERQKLKRMIDSNSTIELETLLKETKLTLAEVLAKQRYSGDEQVYQDLIKLERFVSTPMKYVNIIGLLVNEEELRDLVKDAQNLSLDEYETLALERISSIWKSLQMLHYPWVGRLEICRIDLAHLYLFMDQIERKGGPIQIYRKKLKELENEFKHAQRKYPKIEDICERELIHLDKLLTLF